MFLIGWSVASAVKNIEIERRPLPKREFITQQQLVLPPTPETRPATEEELYDAGWIMREIKVGNKTCFERQGETQSCFIEIYD